MVTLKHGMKGMFVNLMGISWNMMRYIWTVYTNNMIHHESVRRLHFLKRKFKPWCTDIWLMEIMINHQVCQRQVRMITVIGTKSKRNSKKHSGNRHFIIKTACFFYPERVILPTGVGGRMFGGSMCSTQNRFLINQPRTTGFHLQLSTGNV